VYLVNILFGFDIAPALNSTISQVMIEIIGCIILASVVIGLFMAWEKRIYIMKRIRDELMPYTLKRMSKSPAVKEMLNHPLITDLIADMGAKILQGTEEPISQAMRVGNSIIIPYKYNGQKYNVIVPYRQPKPILAAISSFDEISEDVTEKVRGYAGPCGNFHGIPVKPKEIIRNCSSLTINYIGLCIQYDPEHEIQPI
jgi:hypothetical protein